MKLKNILAACIALACLPPSLFAESALEHEYNQLQEQRDKALAAATEPVNRRYKETLEQLMRRATQANDLPLATKLKAELDGMEVKTVGSKFRGRWVKKDNKKHLVEFTPGGNFQEKWSGGAPEGRWKATSETAATISFKNGVVHEYQLSEDGKSVKRLNDGMTWVREE